MQESIRNMAQYTNGMGFQDFLKDIRTRDAVVRNLEVMGEAAMRIPDDIRERYPEIPWAQIVGLRNRLIHGYFLVDYGIVWEIVQNGLSPLRRRLEKIAREVSG
jgi:uncharacterized protein with HEPN domain